MGVFATICIKFLPAGGFHGQPEKMAKFAIGGKPDNVVEMHSTAVCHGVVTRGA